MTRRWVLGLLVWLLLGLVAIPVRSAHAAEGGSSAYDPSTFTISYWCGPPAKFNTLERYREVKEAGFTVAFPSCGGMTVEQNKQMLAYCQQVGLKAVVADARMVTAVGGSAEARAKLDAIVSDYSDCPALLGYFITDEPGAGAFPGLAEVVAYLKQKDPAHPGFINLLPTYGHEALGTRTYEEYVHSFARMVQPFVLSWDHYHFTNQGDREDYFENLQTVRQVALESKVPFWQIVLAVQHFDYRNETEPELRYDAMQTLAFGGRGLLWFTYWSPADSDHTAHWQHAMINPDGSKDPHYDMIQGINADAKAIGDALGHATSTAVFQVGPGAKLPFAVDSPIKPTGDGMLTVGVFASHDGQKTLALVTNRDIKKALKTCVAIMPTKAQVEVFDPASQSWSPAIRAEPETIPLELPAGGGVLLRW